MELGRLKKSSEMPDHALWFHMNNINKPGLFTNLVLFSSVIARPIGLFLIFNEETPRCA
jgi:hypothetical protein